jgi:hypothetical protein
VHALLDWRLALDVLEIVRDGQPSRDRYAADRARAIEATRIAFDWAVVGDPDAPEPVLRTSDGRLIVVVHPLRAVEDHLRGGQPTEHGAALPFDTFNLERRPAAVLRAARG